MNKYHTKTVMKIRMFLFIALVFSGCSYLDNPLKDRETGEDINLLILDFNFFNTRMTLKLLDSGEELIAVPATIRFTGENGSDIVTFAGHKKAEYNTANGQLEVTVDPNVVIAESSPFHFVITVEADGYKKLSKAIQYKSEGKKTIELKLVKDSDETESDLGGDLNEENGDTSFVFSALQNMPLKTTGSQEEPVTIQYEITLNDLLKFKDTNGDLFFSSKVHLLEVYQSNPDDFIRLSLRKFSGYSPGIEVVDREGSPVSLLFHKLESGQLSSILIDGREVGDLNGGVIRSWCEYTGSPYPDLFGFTFFSDDRWIFHGTEIIYNTLDFNYMVAMASEEYLCQTGSAITFRSDVISSFSIDADVFDHDNNLLTTLHFKGNFPETFTVENTPQMPVRLVFRDNNPAFKPISPVEIDDFCTGSYVVDVDPADGYIEYQVVLKAFCPDNSTIAVAPTYSGEFKIIESNDPWQGVDMIGGVVDLLGLPGREYQLRFLWENEWEYSTLVTEFDENGSYLHPSSSKISSEKMADGRIRINMEHHFSQAVCDDLGW